IGSIIGIGIGVFLIIALFIGGFIAFTYLIRRRNGTESNFLTGMPNHSSLSIYKGRHTEHDSKETIHGEEDTLIKKDSPISNSLKLISAYSPSKLLEDENAAIDSGKHQLLKD
ncbi:hypothetical protein PMAYCL1PPCAC_14150, partial [Pristionchus mayeri]